MGTSLSSEQLQVEKLKSETLRRILKAEFERRKVQNFRYSLRAFANHVGVDASSLSHFLSGKRLFNRHTTALIASRLNLEASITAQMKENFHQIEYDVFELISGWQNLAICEAAYLDGFDMKASSLSELFNLPISEVTAILRRLERLQLLERHGGGYRRKAKFLTNIKSPLDTSAAHKTLQRSIVKMALEAIDQVPQEEKDITSMTFAIDESKLDEARAIIKECRRRLSLLLENGKQTRVYQLGVQLYPVSKKLQTDEVKFEKQIG